jgi:hypothetical protein
MNSQNRLRQRTYAVDHHVRYGHRFRAMVRHPALSSDRKPRVRWQAFHEVEPAPGMGAFPAPPAPSARQSAALSLAPESHANLRALASMPLSALSAYGALGAYDGIDYSALNDSTVLPMDLQRYAAAVGGDASQITGGSPTAARAAASARSGELPDVPAFSGGVGGFGAAGGSLFPEIARFAAETTEAGEASLPHAAALHPALLDPDDYADTGAGAEGLSRYAARVFSGTGGVPLRGVTLVPQRPASAGRGATPLSGAGSRGRLADAATRGGEASGPLAGFHAISRTVSHAAGLGEEEAGDEEAGPMHFTAGPSYERGGALRNLKSLFAEDLERAAAEAAAEAEAAAGGAAGAAGASGASGTPGGGASGTPGGGASGTPGGGAPGGTPGATPRGGEDLA